MLQNRSIGQVLCIATATFAMIASAHAATRTFVSNTGNDANVSSSGCSETAPCATFATALTVTKSGGEIVALTGGSYGPLNITTPLTVIGFPGASITGSAGTTAITINLPAGIAAGNTVFIRGIDIDGANNGTNTGIALSSGNLVLRDSKLELLNVGLLVGNNSATAHADVINSDFVGNATAIQTNGAGAAASCPFSCTYPGPGQTEVRINGGNLNDNTTAFSVVNPGQTANNGNANIFIFQSGTQYSLNLTGFTTYLTVSGTGSHASSGSVNDAPVVTYNTNGAPN
jgi:hypothetical protein